MAWRRIGAHEDAVADAHVDVKDLIAPLGSDFVGHGRVTVFCNVLNLSAENFFVKFEGFGAIAVEQEISIYGHDEFPFDLKI